MEITIKIGGEAGQGVQSVGYVIGKALAKTGLSVFSYQDNESRIRGGHNFFQIRASANLIHSFSEIIHVLVALDDQSIVEHQTEIVQDGIVLYDGDKIRPSRSSEALLSVPFERLAKDAAGIAIAANTVAAGATLSLVHCSFNILTMILTETFAKKGSEIVEKNIQAAKSGYEFVKKNLHREFPYRVKQCSTASERLLITGNQAIATSALISGCKFMSGYPMSPSTPIQQYFASKMKHHNVVFEQAEDEIAAINMALGASFAGVRSMVATSGGGFSLMVEGLSLAGMTETPVVIALVQRPGPATGFPTRTEQAELEFVIHAGHGEFPRAVFAPGTPEQAFFLTSKAFNLAERYQIPVIILSDQHLADSYFTTPKFDLSAITIDRGEILREYDPQQSVEYKRHLITESGISPRLYPGQTKGLVVTDSDEHTEQGHITESAEVRVKNVQKRLKIFEHLKKEIASPSLYGPINADALLVGWGSTYGALIESIEVLNQEGYKVRMLHLCEIWPFPTEAVTRELSKYKSLIAVEGNSTGQMAHLIRAETGVDISSKILRYDGRPISPRFIVEEVKKQR